MNPTDPSPDTDALLDLLRGEVSGRKARDIEARLAADPRRRAERDRLARFLSAVTGAHEPPPDRALAERLAVRVREQVGREEAARRREELRPAARRRMLWTRIVAVSVALHVALLAVFAWQQHRVRYTEPGADVVVHLPLPGLLGEGDGAGRELADLEEPRFPGASEWGLDLEPRLSEGARLAVGAGGAPEEEMGLAPLEDVLWDHPRGVALDMAVRRIDALKRRRLDGVGLDPSGTLTAVARGLARLETRQQPDGSYRAGGGRSALGETALALLPFLAEGEASVDAPPAHRTVVPRGIAWLRGRLFRAGAGVEAAASGETAADLGLALRALAEDYVLSYGRLSPAGLGHRAEELRTLAALVAARQRPDGSFAAPGPEADICASVWPMWGLEAAIRTGVVPAPVEVPQRFQRWFATVPEEDPKAAAAGLLLARALGPTFAGPAEARAVDVLLRGEDGPAADPFVVAVGTSGLVLRDPDAYRVWNGRIGARLLAGLDPTGLAREGDEVGETALHLLALQAAYRTY